MSRKPLAAGNWKEHLTEAQAITLARRIQQATRFTTGVDILLCPPYTALSTLSKLLVSSPILLGAQNISQYPEGAYTGEISPGMIREFCTHVIIGHSERRALFGEDDAVLRQKTHLACKSGLIPIFCVGENLDTREKGQTASLLQSQLSGGLGDLVVESGNQIMIAYEPIWAIGTGRSASPGDVSRVIRTMIRPVLANLWGESISGDIRVLYGGSVNPGNAASFFRADQIDGALVGGASLDAGAFTDIVKAATVSH